MEDERRAGGKRPDVVFQDKTGDSSEALVFVGDTGKDMDEVTGIVWDGFEGFETLDITPRQKGSSRRSKA